MLDLFPRLRLSRKIALVGAGSALITAAALSVLATWQGTVYNSLARQEVDSLIDRNLDTVTRAVYDLARVEDEAVGTQVDLGMHVAMQILASAGGVSPGNGPVRWIAVNQLTGEATDVRLPRLLVGHRWPGQNADPSVPGGLVDDVVNVVGGDATIFQRMNERGDMLRVATTVGVAGRRAIGTFIPAIDPDGVPSPVIATVLQGRVFRGRAYVVDNWHLIVCDPLATSPGRVLGMFCVGQEQRIAEARIHDLILPATLGRSGYVFVLGSKPPQRGRYIVSQRGERDGQDIWQSRDSDGHYVVQDIVRRATTLKPGELATVRYRWQNPGERAPRWKMARLAYFAPWDWVIATSAYEDELQNYAAFLRTGRKRVAATTASTGLAIALLVGLLGVFVARAIARPARQLTEAVEAMARGDTPQAVPVRSRDEMGVLAAAFNVMAERLAQTLDGLRRSEEEYRRLFDNVPEGIFQSSIDGRLLRASPALARVMGYDSPAEMVEATGDLASQMYVHPQDRDAMVSAVLGQGGTVEQEVQLRRKDGTQIWVSLAVRAVRDEQDRVVCLQGFLTDITARRQAQAERAKLEDQFQQVQKMESIGRLAGGVAHDFNNMLQAILGNAAWALDEIPPDSPIREHLEEIQKAAQRSADLTRQLLAFARRQAISPRILDLNETVSSTLKMLQRLIGEDITLRFSPGMDIWTVKMDPSQVDQILANLTVNARDAIAGPGQVTIETANVTVDASCAGGRPEWVPGDYVMLAVSDTGRGMSAETQSHLFEPFFTTKEVGKGTGLGLATVFGIVKQNNGSIHVYSEPDLGTTFKLYFPRADVGVIQAPAPAPLTPGALRGTETILLVEDEEQILALGRRILEHRGYTVLAAHAPQVALEMAASHDGPIHLLISDVVMPGMNGKELKARLTAVRPGIRCLFMSGYTADVIVNRGVLDEGVEFLQKPFTVQSLVERVRRVIEAPVGQSAPP